MLSPAIPRIEQQTAPFVPALELLGVTAGYNHVDALDNVSFSIARGRRVALVGPNGAGKSTLFKAVVGLLPIRRGQIRINGSADDYNRQQAAYVPQNEDVDWHFPVSVLDVVMMGLARQIGWLRLPNRSHREVALQALEKVELADLRNRQIGELSGGQKRRVFIARALTQGANTLLLDEPFSGVDQAAQHILYRLLDELCESGVTMLLATHDLSSVTAHFDEVLILNRRVFGYGTPAEVFKPELLGPAFGGQLAIWREDQQTILLADQCCP